MPEGITHSECKTSKYIVYFFKARLICNFFARKQANKVVYECILCTKLDDSTHVRLSEESNTTISIDNYS